MKRPVISSLALPTRLAPWSEGVVLWLLMDRLDWATWVQVVLLAFWAFIQLSYMARKAMEVEFNPFNPKEHHGNDQDQSAAGR